VTRPIKSTVGGRPCISTTELSRRAGTQLSVKRLLELGIKPAHEQLWRGTYWYEDDIPKLYLALSVHFRALAEEAL
jgi:hypothetical protein